MAVSCTSDPMPKFDFNFVTYTSLDDSPPATTISNAAVRKTRNRSTSFVFAGSEI